MRERHDTHRRRTASGANNCLSSRIALLQPSGDGDRRLQQKIALTSNATHHGFYNYCSSDVKQAQHLGI
jgi:hypothetical protein